MEPKDLKNSEELKPTEKLANENSIEKETDEPQKDKDSVSDIEAEKANTESVVGKTEESATVEIADDAVDKATADSLKEQQPEKGETNEATEKINPEAGDNVTEEVGQGEETAKAPENIPVPETDEKGENAEAIPEAQAKPENEKKQAKTSVKEPARERKTAGAKKETIDYSAYSQVELVNAMREVLDKTDDYEDGREEIEVIKSVFYKQFNENVEEAKKNFIEEGGNEDDFEPQEDPYEKDIKDQLHRFKQMRREHNKQMDQEKEENLKLKYEVIEKIKGLINNEESINKTFNEFRDLQQEWRNIGLVPQSKMKNLWDTYHFHVENFYDYIKINRELRDLDLKKNLEMKIVLCEDAEELLVEPSIIKAFKTLQKYHEQWREIGPVPRENKDDIWDRFKTATGKINKKHQDFFESRKDEQKKNLEAKTALCEKAEEISATETEGVREWDEKSKQLIKLQKVWRTIGFAPKKDNTKIYERFRNACDKFFNAKREFYSKNKEQQHNNMQLKIDLCEQAESMKDSNDWRKTTQDFINIQKKWKEIGPIPRKHSDLLWKRFRAACDYFFDKKSEHFSDMDSEQVDNLKLKDELIAEVENFKSTGDVNENLKLLKGFQRRWTEIGHVPFKKKDGLQTRFREAVNKLFDELNIDEEKRNMLKFKSKMSSFSESSRGQSKMRMEREKYMNKLKQLESDLVLLDNNIGFFANTKNAESLIEDVRKKIENSKQKIEALKEKIRVIDEMDN